MIYMATGVAALFAGPLMGRLSDAVGKYRSSPPGRSSRSASSSTTRAWGLPPSGS